jgi:integrase
MGAWTPHDLRRTFSTRLGDLGVAPHVIERMLNHTAEGVAAIYNRAELLEERIAATRLWAAKLAEIVRQ